MRIAVEIRDWAELMIGYCHIDPEKSSIRRGGPKFGFFKRHEIVLKKEFAKEGKMSDKQMRQKAVRDTEKKLAKMGFPEGV